jgi:hypothetical protein
VHEFKFERILWLAGLGEVRWGGMDLIDLAQDREYWRALVNTVMNLRVS